MSIPSEQDDTQTNKADASFADVVNDTVNKLTTDDKGKITFPEGTSEEVKYAATLEKRRRDTQSSFTKAQQDLNAERAEKAELLKQVTGNVKLELTQEQTDELEELKFSDPEAWRKKVNVLEAEAKTKTTNAITEKLKQVSTSTLATEELERRQEVMKEFVEANPGFELNDDVIANDIPPRIVKKLETGKISFEAFLQECYDYTKTGKVIKQDVNVDQPNLSKVGGSHQPDTNAQKEDIILSYKKETF